MKYMCNTTEDSKFEPSMEKKKKKGVGRPLSATLSQSPHLRARERKSKGELRDPGLKEKILKN